jgi:HAD superfamily hydrolase (TIGR01509 family)
MVFGVIFDIDGTLVTFRFDVRGTRKALIEELERQGFETGGLDLTTPTQKILDAARKQSEGGKGPAYEPLRRSVFAILDQFETESVSSTEPFPGVRDLLDGLLSRGVRLAVLTNSGRRAALEALRKAGLLDRFEFVLTRDDTEIMKPRPEGLEMAAARLGLAKGSVYYVGDSPFDIQAAKAAGIRIISVATGNYTVERLRAEGADFTAAGISQVSTILGF